jgi:hypothetical protein
MWLMGPCLTDTGPQQRSPHMNPCHCCDLSVEICTLYKILPSSLAQVPMCLTHVTCDMCCVLPGPDQFHGEIVDSTVMSSSVVPPWSPAGS